MSVTMHIRRVLPIAIYGGNVVLLLGWHELAGMFLVIVSVLIVLLCLLD